MDILLISMIIIEFLILVGVIIYFKSNSKNDRRIIDNDYPNEPNPPKKRENVRIRMDIPNTEIEITKIGDVYSYHKEIGDVVDISVGGVGMESKVDLPIRKKVQVLIHLKMNNQEFEIEGKLVRKNENLYRQKIFYGIEFTNLKEGVKNKLAKEIFAYANKKRKLPIK